MQELKIEITMTKELLLSDYESNVDHVLKQIRAYFDDFLRMTPIDVSITINAKQQINGVVRLPAAVVNPGSYYEEIDLFSLSEISFAFVNYKGSHTELTSVFNSVASLTNFFDNLDQEQSSLVKLHFLSQLMHESQRGKYTTELADGSVYEGSKILGNVEPGDGKKFKGRGFIQLTGRDNYTRFSQWLDNNDISPNNTIVNYPNVVATDLTTNVLSAFWFWISRKITPAALTDTVYLVTRKINGGTNGLAERIQYYFMLKKFMKEGL